MEQQITLIISDKEIETHETLNKLQIEQKILELFETKEIEMVEITYKKRESAEEKNKNNILNDDIEKLVIYDEKTKKVLAVITSEQVKQTSDILIKLTPKS